MKVAGSEHTKKCNDSSMRRSVLDEMMMEHDFEGDSLVVDASRSTGKKVTIATADGIFREGCLKDDRMQHNPETHSLVTGNNVFEQKGDSTAANKFYDEDAEMDQGVRAELLLEEQASFARIKDGHVESKLSEDTTSFIITSPLCSSPFNVAAVVSTLKLLVFTLAFVNAFQQPPAIAISTSVAITQLLALLFASATQDDMVVCVKFIHEGYGAVEGHFDGGVTYGKWAIAVLLSLLEGVFGLATIFELTTQSRSAVDVLLNFAAVAFVAKLDSSAFWLASLGFFGSAAKHESEKVVGTCFRVSHSKKLGYTRKMLLLMATFGVMLIPWTFIVIHQQHGRYAPSFMMVQFDDEANPSLATYSGVYELKPTRNVFSSDLFHWTERTASEESMRGEFGYCSDRWEFFLRGDQCGSPLVKSIETEKYDLLKATPSENWFISLDSRSFRMESFTLVPVCQKRGIHSCGPDARCETGTNKIAGQCECNNDAYGIRCQYSVLDTCRQLEIDDRYNALPANRILAHRFDLLLTNETAQQRGKTTPLSKNDLVLVYDHPVYVGSSARGQKGVDVLFYSGLRWVVASSVDGFVGFTFNNVIDSDLTLLATFLNREDFHSKFKVKKVDIVSEAVIFQSRQDTAAPIEIAWVALAESAELSKIELIEIFGAERLLCADCNNSTNKCSYEGRCNSTRQCECENGAKGVLCQVTPSGDGFCDEYFNNLAFQYDDGDCCEESCTLNEADSPFACGVILTETGGTPPETTVNFIGFGNCSNPALLSTCEEGRGCWAVSGPQVSQDFTYSRLSSNGRVLLVNQPLSSSLVVYDRTLASGWVQRGGNIVDILGLEVVLFKNTTGTMLMQLVTLPAQVFGTSSTTKELPIWFTFITSKPNSDLAFAVFVTWNSRESSWERFIPDLELPFVNFDREYTLIEDIRMDLRLTGKQELDVQLKVRGTNGTLATYETSSPPVVGNSQQQPMVDQFEGPPSKEADGCELFIVEMNTAVAVHVWDCKNGASSNEIQLQVQDLKSRFWTDLMAVNVCGNHTLEAAVLDDTSDPLSLTLSLSCWSNSTGDLVIQMVHLKRVLHWNLGYNFRLGIAYQLPFKIFSLINLVVSQSHTVITHFADGENQTVVFAYDDSDFFQLGNTLYGPGLADIHYAQDEPVLMIETDEGGPDIYYLYSSCNPEKAVSLVLSISTGLRMEFISWDVLYISNRNQESPYNISEQLSTVGFDRRTIIREEFCVNLEGLDRLEIFLDEDSPRGCSFGMTLNGTSLFEDVDTINYEEHDSYAIDCTAHFYITSDRIKAVLAGEY